MKHDSSLEFGPH